MTIELINIVNFPNDPKEPYIWACRLVNEYDMVTHWMPLPQTPTH
jgi:hypothetical protein